MLYDKIPRFTEEDWISFYIERGASEAEACQLRNLRYTYGIVTGVNNAGEPGVWAYSIDLSTVQEILGAWELEPRIKDALLQLKSDFEAKKVKEGRPRRLSCFSGLVAKLLEASF